MLRSHIGALLTLFGLAFVVSAIADDKEVPYPKLPSRAGKIHKNLPKSFTATKSGLKYRVLRNGDGAVPAQTDTVEANYHGWLDNRTVFDTTYLDDKKNGFKNETKAFPLDKVIPGWTEGMQLVGKGGMIELDIPPHLAYGQKGLPPKIPPGAQLHFVVEIIDIKK